MNRRRLISGPSPLALEPVDCSFGPDVPDAQGRFLDIRWPGEQARARGAAFRHGPVAGKPSKAHGRFARHLRTNLHEKGGVRDADAVYTKTPSLLRGAAISGVQVGVTICADNGIPTV